MTKLKNPIKNVAVIGAGFSGMAVSLLLAQAGKEVILIERDEAVAPLLRNYTYQDGYEVNNAFQYLGGYYTWGSQGRIQLCYSDRKPVTVHVP